MYLTNNISVLQNESFLSDWYFVNTHISNLISLLNTLNIFHHYCRYIFDISKHGVNPQDSSQWINRWSLLLLDNANLLQIWIVHGSKNKFYSISGEKGEGSMLDLFFSTVDGCATQRTTGYKVVYALGTLVCNIVKKTNGTCEVLCQNFFIGRQQVNSCRTMSRVARFACNQHFSQVRCIHTHACAWSSSMVRRIRIWLVAKEKLR